MDLNAEVSHYSVDVENVGLDSSNVGFSLFQQSTFKFQHSSLEIEREVTIFYLSRPGDRCVRFERTCACFWATSLAVSSSSSPPPSIVKSIMGIFGICICIFSESCWKIRLLLYLLTETMFRDRAVEIFTFWMREYFVKASLKVCVSFSTWSFCFLSPRLTTSLRRRRSLVVVAVNSLMFDWVSWLKKIQRNYARTIINDDNSVIGYRTYRITVPCNNKSVWHKRNKTKACIRRDFETRSIIFIK